MNKRPFFKHREPDAQKGLSDLRESLKFSFKNAALSAIGMGVFSQSPCWTKTDKGSTLSYKFPYDTGVRKDDLEAAFRQLEIDAYVRGVGAGPGIPVGNKITLSRRDHAEMVRKLG